MDVVKRFLLALVVLAAVLIWPAASQAKELSSFKACGASGCKEIKEPALLRTLIHTVEAQGEPVSVPTPQPAPFVRLEFRFKGEQNSPGPTFSQYYVPSRGRILLRTDPNAWAWVSAGDLRPVLARVIAGVTPYAKPTITSVTLLGKQLGPAAHTRVYSVRPTTYSVPNEPDWVPVVVKTSRPSPWSKPAATLEYSPSKQVLWRGSEFVKLDGALDSTESESFPWAFLFGGLGGAAVVIPAALFARRRRTR
jgi:hypothetical protein